jgi:CHAD domain-containing protein
MTARSIKLALPGRFAMPRLVVDDVEVVATAVPEVALRATYFDTADLRLARHGAELRHRAGGVGMEAWTLKMAPASGAPDADRTEIHFADPGREPPAAARSLVTALVRREPLVAVATLRTRRRPIRLLVDGSAVAEMEDDEVSVIEQRRIVSRFRELEIVALADDVDLRALAAQLIAAGASEAEPIPKVVRALGSKATAPPDAAPVVISADATLADVLRLALADALDRIVRHDAVARLGDEPEGVHQLRVGFRRLHSDLRTLSDAVDPQWRARVEPQLGAVVGALGQARDLDVLLGGFRGEVAGAEAARLAPLFSDLERRRAEARANLRLVLDGDAYIGLLDDLVAAVADPPVGETATARASVALPALTMAAWDRVARRADRLEPDSPVDDFHRVRIAAKRARYAVDLAARVLPGRTGAGAARMAAKIAEIQDQLGALQDAAVAEAAIRTSVTGSRMGVAFAFEAGRLVERARQRSDEARAHFLRAWPEVRRKRWRKWAE